MTRLIIGIPLNQCSLIRIFIKNLIEMSIDFLNSASFLYPSIGTILVPQGIEYQTVWRAMGDITAKPSILAIPVGIDPLTAYLRTQAQFPEFLNSLSKGVLVMGLCGSLTSQYGVGQGVLYDGCGYVKGNQWQWEGCDSALNDQIQTILADKVVRVKGISCDRVISSAVEKKRLAQKYSVDMVDMEGFAILRFCNARKIPCTMLRVISDDCTQALPDLSVAFEEQGQLNSVKLAVMMLKAPFASLRLIQSSLNALQQLKRITHHLKS